MFIERFFLLIIYSSSIVDLCSHQINTTIGRIIFDSYENNVECYWIFNLSLINNPMTYRALLLTFHHFDTEFGHDELLIGESIDDVSTYNSKFYRFSGSKRPDPCYIPLRDERLTRPIWMQFLSDHSTTGSGFILDYVFLVNQSLSLKPKPARTLINAHIRRPSINETKTNKVKYSFPFGTISSPNYPQNYSNHIICRWDFYHRDAFIRFYIDRFDTEFHYDTLTLYLGQNINNRAMILHEWSGQDLSRRHFLIPNDRVLLVFQTDKSQNSSGFLLHYEIIEKEKSIINLYETNGTIYSKGYPVHLRTNIEYQWRIHMNESEEIEIDLTDIQLDDDHDSLQILNGRMIYNLNRPRFERFFCTNQTIIILLRTKHTTTDEQYRGFHLTYRKLSHQIDNDHHDLIDDPSKDLPCGKTFSAPNGTIELNIQTAMSLDCLMFIEVDDGQNIFLRFDSIDWDNRGNRLEIGLFHYPNQSQLFQISDVMPGNWFVANDSQLWIRLNSDELSLGSISFRLFYSETIQWSTVSPKSEVQILHDHRLFPYRIISKPIIGIYQNLTKKNVWHIDALDDESITIVFHSFESFENQHICFQLSDMLETSHICTSEQFPFALHRIGSWSLSIEPEFIWTLVQYEIQIEKSKKVTNFYQIDFDDVDHLLLPMPNSSDPFVHLEWFVRQTKSPSTIIFDIENSDGETPADLFIIESDDDISKSFPTVSARQNLTSYSLGKTFQARLSHVSSLAPKSFRIIYQSYALPWKTEKRSFRLKLHKISQSYYHENGFHYVVYDMNGTNSEWLIEGQNETSTFIGRIFSNNDRITLQTTADVNLTVSDIWKEISSSDFHLRCASECSSRFLLILYENMFEQLDEPVRLTKSNGVMKTFDQMSFQIEIDSQRFDLLDLIIVQGDLDMIIHLSDRNSKNRSDYFLFNSRENLSSSIIGLRFTIRTVRLDVHLRSVTHRPIELRYKARRTSTLTTDETFDETCWLSDVKVCNKHNNSRCNENCSNWFQLKSSMMNQTKMQSYFWPYALRGSVTLIIENINLETFEKIIYRNLKQSIAKIVRKFCSIDAKNCLSEDFDAIRSDHVIIQSYDEQFDDQRLYVALFVKDPYRQSIALTNEQVLTALQDYQDELHQEIKHQIHLPTSVLEKNLLDPVWLYGVCLMALIVLLVVILMLMSVLMKRTKYRPTKDRHSNGKIPPVDQRLIIKTEKRLIPVSIPLTNDEDEDEQTSSTDQNKTDTSQTSNSTALAQLLPSAPPIPSAPTVSFFHFKTTPTSYFNSNIESAMVRRLEEDDEPIPFIDDNLSIANSRKSSACWSDRTSLSSRLGFSRKFNFRRSRSQLRTDTIQEQDGRKRKRRHHQHRSNHLSILPQEQLRINEFV